MARNIEVHTRLAQPALAKHGIEMCEHKGIGHPDTIADGICEAASRELSLEYRRQCGRVLHHNLDKGLLMAGCSQPRFGGGRIVKPMRFIICGRATPLPHGGAAADIALEAARRYLRTHVGFEADPATLSAEIGQTSDNLKQVFEGSSTVARANDTSFGVGYAPYSPLERCVLKLADQIHSPAFRARFPAAGADFKVMGCRRGDAVTVTVALALIDRHVDSVSRYFEIKLALHDALAAALPLPAQLRINMLDNPNARDESGLYLTVTGLSGEMGDDGQVGRGNRVNGLITPGRPMSLEAAAGKNPVSHVGKLYNVLALLIARDIHAGLEELDEVRVQLLSAIGEPVDQPQVASIEITSTRRVSPSARARAAEIADRWLSDPTRVTNMILDERVALF